MLGNLYRALFVIIVVFPFLGQGVPYPGGLPLFLPFIILLVPATALLRISEQGMPGLRVGDFTFMAVSAFTLLTYVYGMAISTEYPGATILKEAANGIVAMMVVFSIANSGWTATDRDKLVIAVAWAMLAVGVFAGVLGAWKFWLFVSAGELLDFVVVATGDAYPWGTSLNSDYNFYALTILAAILSAMFLSTGRPPVIQATLAGVIAALIVVGFLAGSRRFWLVAPLFLGLQGIWMISRSGIASYATLFVTLLLFLLGLPIAVLISSDESVVGLVTAGWGLQDRFMTVLDTSQTFGMSSRFEMWSFAVDNLDGRVPWMGSGFDYMNRFSCQFGDCSGGGYPHMPFLSAYLYGGWIAGLAALVLYAYITIAGFRLFAHGFTIGWLCFPLMAAFFFAAVSGNGPYSIRSYIMLGAMCVGFLWTANIDDSSSRRRETAGD